VRPRIGVLAVAAAGLVATAVVVVPRLLDDDPESPDGGAEATGWTDRQQALLETVAPSPDCPPAAPPPPVAEGEVLLDVLRVRGTCLTYEAVITAAGGVEARLTELRAEPDVLAADESVGLALADARTSPAAVRQGDPWGQWALDDLDAEDARELWPEGASVVASVIDTGIDEDHPDFGGAVRDAAPDRRVGHGTGSGHGTHVAGIVAATEDEHGVEGLMPSVDLLDAQLLEAVGDNPTDVRPVATLAERIIWSVDHGAQVINMSITEDGRSTASAVAVRYALRHRVVLVAAAGNLGDDAETDDPDSPDSEVRYPAGYEGVIGVAAYDHDGERSTWSANNATVDLAAPGAGIVSTWRRDVACPPMAGNPLLDDRARIAWCLDEGTSMAAPYVAAAAALLKARQPGADAHQVTRALLTSARPAPSRDAQGSFYGAGKLDPSAAARALDELMDVLRESNGADPLVAVRADGAATLAVVDAFSGQRALLAHVTGSMGTPSYPLRWSPDGRYVAGRTDDGYVTAWDAGELDFGSPEEAESIDVGSEHPDVGGRVVDFAFVDDTTAALLVTEDFLGAAMIDQADGTVLRYHDLATGELSDPVATPRLDRIVGHLGEDDVLLAIERQPNPTGGPGAHGLVWLRRDGRVLRRTGLGHAGDRVTAAVPSPDGSTVAVALAVPEQERSMAGEVGDPLVSLVVVDTVTGAVTDVELPGPDTVLALRHVRWSPDGDDLVANLRRGDVGPMPDRRETIDGLVAYDGDSWRRLDGDPLLAATTVGDDTQIVLTDDREDDLHGTGDLYVLWGPAEGEAGDAFAEPTPTGQPVAGDVSDIWLAATGEESP